MDLGADMVRDEADDPLAVRRREPLTCIRKPVSKPVDPEPTVGIEHDLDDRRVCEPGGHVRSERCAEHAGAALDRF